MFLHLKESKIIIVKIKSQKKDSFIINHFEFVFLLKNPF